MQAQDRPTACAAEQDGMAGKERRPTFDSVAAIIKTLCNSAITTPGMGGGGNKPPDLFSQHATRIDLMTSTPLASCLPCTTPATQGTKAGKLAPLHAQHVDNKHTRPSPRCSDNDAGLPACSCADLAVAVRFVLAACHLPAAGEVEAGSEYCHCSWQKNTHTGLPGLDSTSRHTQTVLPARHRLGTLWTTTLALHNSDRPAHVMQRRQATPCLGHADRHQLAAQLLDRGVASTAKHKMETT